MAFDDFWRNYPRKRDKFAARTAYDRALKHAPAEFIDWAAGQYAEETTGRDQHYIKHPQTWLNAGSFFDYEQIEEVKPANVIPMRRKVFVAEDSPQWKAWCQHEGRKLPVKDGGWWFDSEWPPNSSADKCTA